MDCLIGYTGFVGGNLAVQRTFDVLINSKNFETMQTLGAVEKGKGGDGFAQIVRLSYWFLFVSMSLVCLAFWCCPEAVVRLFGGGDRPELIPEAASALRLFSPSFGLVAPLVGRCLADCPTVFRAAP